MLRPKFSLAIALSICAHCATHAAPCQSVWRPAIGQPGANGPILALCVWDDGNGPALCVGGTFTQTGGLPISNLARWDGRHWSTVGGGTDGGVWTLATYDDGNGDALYVGGEFAHAGGVAAANVARWDGLAFNPLGTGIVAMANGTGDPGIFQHPAVDALVVFDDGGGRFAGALTPAGSTLSVGNLVGWGCPYRRGDLNCDQAIDFDDINAFVAALGGDAAYSAAFPDCHRELADLDRDGKVTFKDINPFVARLGQ